MDKPKYAIGIDVSYAPGVNTLAVCVMTIEDKEVQSIFESSNRLSKIEAQIEFEKLVKELAEKYPSCLILEEGKIPRYRDKKLTLEEERDYMESLMKMEESLRQRKDKSPPNYYVFRDLILKTLNGKTKKK